MTQLQRVASPQMLRMEFHAQGDEVRLGEIIEISELQKRTLLFSFYSSEALVDFCAWMCYRGEFSPCQAGAYLLTDLGWGNHRVIRQGMGRKLLPVTKKSELDQDASFQKLRKEFHLQGHRLILVDVFPVSQLLNRMESFRAVSEEVALAFVRQMCQFGELYQLSPPMDWVYSLTDVGLVVHHTLRDAHQVRDRPLPYSDEPPQQAKLPQKEDTTPQTLPVEVLPPVDFDALADLLLEEVPLTTSVPPEKKRRTPFRLRQVVVEMSPLNADAGEIRRITDAMSSNLESMLADLRACFG